MTRPASSPRGAGALQHIDTPQADGERLASWLRLMIALAGLVVLGVYHFYSADMSLPGIYLTALAAMVWAALSTGYLALIQRARYVPWMSYVSVLADIVMVTAVQAVNISSMALSFVNAPVTYLYFVMIGLAALRRSRRLAVFAGVSSAIFHLITSGVAYLLYIPSGYVFAMVGEHPVEISFLDEVGIAVLMAILGWIIGHVTRELRESERQYQELFENAPDGILVVSADQRILTVNQRFADMVGTPRSRLAGRLVSEFLGSEDDLEASSAPGLAPQSAPTTLARGDGTEIAVRAASVPVEYHGQACTEMSVRDVAEQVQLEQQLAQSQKMESLGRLAGGLAHDFNNILGGVIGATSLAERALSREVREDVRPDLQARFTRIRGHSERARQVIRRLLTFSRSQSIETAPINLAELIEEVAGICRDSLGSQIEVAVELPESPAAVEADGTALTQALLNLCINAADAMDGRGRIIVRVVPIGATGDLARRFPAADPGQPYWAIEVEDEGVGIAPEMLGLIFDPFFTTKPPGEGTGLGLSMVYNIARQHGGFVDVSSIPGKGSVFRMLLSQARASLIPAADDDEDLPHGSGTVLVVDDDEIVRSTIAGMLVELGYEVVTASSGRDALRRIEARPNRIDLILLDMVMPYMDGGETLRQVRLKNHKVPVIITSGFWSEERAGQLDELRVAGFLRKPFSFKSLATKVAAAITRRG